MHCHILVVGQRLLFQVRSIGNKDWYVSITTTGSNILKPVYILLEVIEYSDTPQFAVGIWAFSSTFPQRSNMMFRSGRDRFLLALDLDLRPKTLFASFHDHGDA
jgi:hypothetical protein